MDTLGIEVADNWQVAAGAGTFFAALVALIVFAIMRDADARKWRAKCKEGSERWREDSARWLADLATMKAEAVIDREAQRREAAFVDKLLDRLAPKRIDGELNHLIEADADAGLPGPETVRTRSDGRYADEKGHPITRAEAERRLARA